VELMDAEFVLGLCRQFHCLPSQLEGEDIEILRLLKIEELGTPEPEETDYSDYDDYETY